MVKKPKAKKSNEEKSPLEGLLLKQNDLLQKHLIVTLALAGVPQQTIRQMLGIDLNKVTSVVKHLKKDK